MLQQGISAGQSCIMEAYPERFCSRPEEETTPIWMLLLTCGKAKADAEPYIPEDDSAY